MDLGLQVEMNHHVLYVHSRNVKVQIYGSNALKPRKTLGM